MPTNYGPESSNLGFVALLLCVEGLVGAAAFARRAPAFSASVIVGLLAGTVRFALAERAAGVPLQVMVWISVGLAVGGCLGLIVLRGRPPSRTLKRWGVAFAATALPATFGLTLLLDKICPMYVSGRDAGYCNYQGMDVLGGWVSAVALLFFADMVGLALLLVVSAWQIDARSADVQPSGVVAVEPLN